jgi:hypothetical protein
VPLIISCAIILLNIRVQLNIAFCSPLEKN